MPLGGKDAQLFDNGKMVARQSLMQAIFESLNDAEVCTLLASFCTDEPGTFDENAIAGSVEFESSASGLISVNSTGSSYFGCGKPVEC